MLMSSILTLILVIVVGLVLVRRVERLEDFMRSDPRYQGKR